MEGQEEGGWRDPVVMLAELMENAGLDDTSAESIVWNLSLDGRVIKFVSKLNNIPDNLIDKKEFVPPVYATNTNQTGFDRLVETLGLRRVKIYADRDGHIYLVTKQIL